MNVSLTPQLEKLVSRRVASGRYGSASEVIREALRLLEQREQAQRVELDRLRAAVAVGLQELSQGRRVPFDDAAVARIKAEGRRRVARSKKRV
jgi:antitoxin ParD1/3/4